MNVPGAFPDADEANETMNENGRNAPGLVNRFDDDGDDDGMMDDDGMLDDDDDPLFDEDDGDEPLGGMQDDDEDLGGGDEDPGDGGQLRIAFDSANNQILLLSANGAAQRLTAEHLRGSTLTMAAIRAMLRARFGVGNRGQVDSEDEDGSDDEGGMYGWGSTARNRKVYYPVITTPQPAGLELLRSGGFGKPPSSADITPRKFNSQSSNIASILRNRETLLNQPKRGSINDVALPNSAGTVCAEFQSKVYCGAYSVDGTFFYAATQSFKVYLFDTSKAPSVGSKSVTDNTPAQTASRRSMREHYWEYRSSLKTTKIFNANDLNCRWTITDANLSPDNEWLIYSSITPRVHLVKTHGEGFGTAVDESDQITLDFAAGPRGSREFGIWSLRFSNDAQQIVAGGTDGQLALYDVESRRTTLRVKAHTEDVNAVAFADSASSNLLLSGSDDCLLKVWDIRSLKNGRPSGTLAGHTEGITYLAPKGDGRYCISNGKDQTLRLWDLRTISEEMDEKIRVDRRDYGISGWDYRNTSYAKPRFVDHPYDMSVMKYRGHAVLRTLIRCDWSPVATTNQQYLYSGSSDGRIHIWSLDGTVVQTLDRRFTHPLMNDSGEYNDPASLSLRSTVRPPKGSYTSTIRDVAWHPTEPSLMSTAWESQRGVEGSLAKHEWCPPAFKGETLEDQAQRQVDEAAA